MRPPQGRLRPSGPTEHAAASPPSSSENTASALPRVEQTSGRLDEELDPDREGRLVEVELRVVN